MCIRDSNTDIEYYNSSDKADGKADLATYNAGVGNDQMNTSTGTDLWAKIYACLLYTSQPEQ